MAKAKDTPAADPQASADTDTVSSPQPQTQPAETGTGADPGLGTAGPEHEHPTEGPQGQKVVQLSGGWIDNSTGESHAPGDWVKVDEQTANDLNTAGYVVRNADGTPRTGKQAAEEAKAQREAAKMTERDSEDRGPGPKKAAPGDGKDRGPGPKKAAPAAAAAGDDEDEDDEVNGKGGGRGQ